MAGSGNLLRGRGAAYACALVALAAMLALAPSALAGKTPQTPFKVAPGVFLGDKSTIGVDPQPGGPGPAKGGDAEKRPRIVGGVPLDISDVPWQTAITLSPNLEPGTARDRQFCGGSLVAPTVVITAAHCIFNQDGTDFQFAPSELAAVTGRTVLSSTQGQEIQVTNFFVAVDEAGFPLYNPNNSSWDVAILELAQPSTTGGLIQLPGPGETELWSQGRRAIVSGWGHTSFKGTPSDQLLGTEVYMTRESTCDFVYEGNFDPSTSTCAGVFNGGRDSCQGDSGGPLAVPTAQGTHRLVGDVQSGIGCAEPRTPGIYGRFGTDPVQTALRNAVLSLSNVDIVGSGATPPTDFSPPQGQDLGWAYAEDACNRSRKCREFASNRCKLGVSTVQCRIILVSKLKKGRKKTCKQNVLFSAGGGTIAEEPVGKKKCKKKKRR